MLAELIPLGSSMLDIGCGDGKIDYMIMKSNQTVKIQGLEVHPRPECLIECKNFDGIKIPLEDSSTDLCMLVDVMHHTSHIDKLMMECCRVSRRHILIKDHLCESKADFVLLKFMDWVGNRPHRIKLLCNYLSKQKWDEYFSLCNLKTVLWNSKIPLYPYPLNKIFGRNLHFIALLEKS